MSKNGKMITILVALIALIGAGAAFMSGKVGKKDDASTETASTEEGTKAATDSSKDDSKDESKDEAESKDKKVIVAKVNGEDVTRADLVKFVSTLPPQMQQMPINTLYPMALEQVVNAKIVDQKAKDESGLDSSDEYEKRLDEAKVQIKRALYVEQEIEKQVTDERLKAAYEDAKAKQKPVEEVHARHILVDSEAKAKDLIAKLKAGADFATLAKENSKDPSNKDNGGDLGYFTKDSMVKSFANAAFAMNKGDISSTPVKTQFGYHVVKVEDKRMAEFPAFEKVRDALAVQVRRQILDELVKQWSSSAQVERFDLNGQPLPAPKTESAPAPAAESTEAPKAEEKKAD